MVPSALHSLPENMLPSAHSLGSRHTLRCQVLCWALRAGEEKVRPQLTGSQFITPLKQAEASVTVT